MILNVLAPEWSLGKAWSDFSSASILQDQFEVLRKLDEVSWSRTHTHFANMGGFTICFTNLEHSAAGSALESCSSFNHGMTEICNPAEVDASCEMLSTQHEITITEETNMKEREIVQRPWGYALMHRYSVRFS